MSKKARKNQGNKRGAGTHSVASGRFKDAVALHKEALDRSSIKDTEIVARIVSAFRIPPPIKAATPISKILGGEGRRCG
jgi:hypothetical protein